MHPKVGLPIRGFHTKLKRVNRQTAPRAFAAAENAYNLQERVHLNSTIEMFGAGRRTRTPYQRITYPLLYQMS